MRLADLMALTKDDIRLAAERLNQAEKTRKQIRGSFMRPIETRKGDTIQADYGAYGSVSCYA